jgi:FMN phosphatase YigB (HAD superfamily)
MTTPDIDLCDLYDLYIFDLDDTILLHSSNKEYREKYERKVISFLETLQKRGKKLALVTYNTNPRFYLEELGIYHLFSYIYTPYITSFDNYKSESFDIKQLDDSTVWIRRGGKGSFVTICKNKHVIIKELLDNLSIPNHKAIFFDDHKLHITSVEKLGVKSILSDPLLGIPFDKIDLKTIN